eukprot:3212498-Prorocentrum_lima.AAC.1
MERAAVGCRSWPALRPDVEAVSVGKFPCRDGAAGGQRAGALPPGPGETDARRRGRRARQGT